MVSANCNPVDTGEIRLLDVVVTRDNTKRKGVVTEIGKGAFSDRHTVLFPDGSSYKLPVERLIRLANALG